MSSDTRSVTTGSGAGAVDAVARAVDLVKVYGEGEAEVRALDGVSVDFPRRRLTAIMGPSGSGKSTLMHCMAALDRVTSGEVEIDGVRLGGLRDRGLTKLRRDRLGFVFQAYNLVPTLTARENITLPLDIAGKKVDQEWFDTVVDTVGLRDRLSHRPNQLSGGQQQRVAIARSLVGSPRLLLADEPTGNLDTRTSLEIMEILQRLNRERGISIVLVTHEADIAEYAERIVTFRDGRVVRDVAVARRRDAARELAALPPPQLEEAG